MARQMIAGTFTPDAQASLPIMLMSKTGVPTHFCAWYASDGVNSLTTNSIVEPARSTTSGENLKCPLSLSGYSPENDQYLMRVACRRK